jgi:hypothetical protein
VDIAREASAVEMNDDIYENLQDNFVQEYTATHMKNKSQKHGTWASIFGELFKNGLFELTS